MAAVIDHAKAVVPRGVTFGKNASEQVGVGGRDTCDTPYREMSRMSRSPGLFRVTFAGHLSRLSRMSRLVWRSTAGVGIFDRGVVALADGSAALPVVVGRLPSSRAIPVNSSGEVRQWERF